MSRSRVLLPAPKRPMMPKISPLATAKLTAFSAWNSAAAVE